MKSVIMVLGFLLFKRKNHFCNITHIYICDNGVLNEKNSLNKWNRRIERVNNFKQSNFERLHTFCGDFYTS